MKHPQLSTPFTALRRDDVRLAVGLPHSIGLRRKAKSIARRLNCQADDTNGPFFLILEDIDRVFCCRLELLPPGLRYDLRTTGQGSVLHPAMPGLLPSDCTHHKPDGLPTTAVNGGYREERFASMAGVGG